MSQRDTGWIQLYCSSVQEVLDTVLCAYRIAETTLLPVLVCLEGFLLSHTSEVLDVPPQEQVDDFLPELRLPEDVLLEPGRPRTYSAVPELPSDYFEFQRHVADAADGARTVIAEVAAEFGEHFGRPKTGSLEVLGNPNAGAALVTVGTAGDTAQELLETDDDLLVVRVHAYRPFPGDELVEALEHVARVAVIDRAAAFGSFGPLGGDVRALELRNAEAVVDVVCGLGGAEVTPTTLRWALEEARSGSPRARVWAPRRV
jgi:pyruvate ferredoxin oxidoreductase alpha subunit